jgi:hypothetical protein
MLLNFTNRRPLSSSGELFFLVVCDEKHSKVFKVTEGRNEVTMP